MSSRIPRKQRNLKDAATQAANQSVEFDKSNCSDVITLEQANNYQLYGFGKTLQSYKQGEVTDFGATSRDSDAAKQVDGRNAKGVDKNLKDSTLLIKNSLDGGLPTTGANYYFSGQDPTGVTGSSMVNFVFSKDGPQSAYIPQLVGGRSNEYIFWLPSTVTGADGANMPATANRSFKITLAGAVAPGESVQVYNRAANGTFNATGSTYTFSASFCKTPNFSTQSVLIPTSSLAGTGLAGIAIKYTASFAVTDNKENTPYAGLCAIIHPSNEFES